ncbi:MAG: DUF1350 family protein [Cyanobacteria bacterium P01_A01_bin.135]
MNWRDVRGNWILMPRNPKAMIHFLGGAFVAGAPHLTYRWLLEQLASEGYAVVATPFINTMDHTAIAHQVLLTFDRAQDYLRDNFQRRHLPIYGLGHSMGCKVHLLIGSLFEEERAGNIFLSFNNFPARRSIPLLEEFTQASSQVSSLFDMAKRSFPALEQLTQSQVNPANTTMEFVPSPEETMALAADHYGAGRTMLVRFKDDEIDQCQMLHDTLQRSRKLVTLRSLPGTHLTPLGQDIPWQSGTAFSPIDAMGQLVKQELYRDLNRLKREMLAWLDPVAASAED